MFLQFLYQFLNCIITYCNLYLHTRFTIQRFIIICGFKGPYFYLFCALSWTSQTIMIRIKIKIMMHFFITYLCPDTVKYLKLILPCRLIIYYPGKPQKLNIWAWECCKWPGLPEKVSYCARRKSLWHTSI